MTVKKYKLKSIRPITVRTSNGKTYNLIAGTNTLELELEDYNSLLEALGIKTHIVNRVDTYKKPIPMNRSKSTDDRHRGLPLWARRHNLQEVISKESVKETTSINNEITETAITTNEKALENIKTDETEVTSNETLSVEVTADSKIDYLTWSYSDLKAEYKKRTGNTCKLKKDDLIKFLQEN